MTYDPDDDPNIDYTVYAPDGAIIGCGWSQRSVVEKLMEQGNCLPVASNAMTQYVMNGQVVDKTPCPAYLDSLTLRDVPVPAVVHIDRTRYETTEPTIELSFNLPGTYKILIESVPHLSVTLEVTV